MSKKEEFFKERFKQALDSTYKVISEELHNLSKKENPKIIEDYKISSLYSREDYIKFRALTDSNALKKNSLWYLKQYLPRKVCLSFRPFVIVCHPSLSPTSAIPAALFVWVPTN